MRKTLIAMAALATVSFATIADARPRDSTVSGAAILSLIHI